MGIKYVYKELRKIGRTRRSCVWSLFKSIFCYYILRQSYTKQADIALRKCIRKQKFHSTK